MWINEVKITFETEEGDDAELTVAGPLAEVNEDDPGSSLADVRNTLMSAFEEITGRPVEVVFPEYE
ncbi:MAG: hypothetical protein EHM35_03115 [Planctomycetaceae bacterium]|nr:MAG: hypothetical protein EHM35_03115 [Planctomycetaceae bacterium]